MKILPLQPESSVFCSFAYTGQDRALVDRRTKVATEAFRSVGVEVYCYLEDETIKAFTSPMEYIDAAVAHVHQSTHLFAIKTLGLSIGQICEMQTARDNDIPIIFAEHTEAATEKSYLRDFADHLFQWETEAELAAGIHKLV